MIYTLQSSTRSHVKLSSLSVASVLKSVSCSCVVFFVLISVNANSRIGDNGGRYTQLFRQFLERSFFFKETGIYFYILNNKDMCRSKYAEKYGIDVYSNNDLTQFDEHLSDAKIINNSSSKKSAIEYMIKKLTCNPFLINIDTEGFIKDKTKISFYINYDKQMNEDRIRRALELLQNKHIIFQSNLIDKDMFELSYTFYSIKQKDLPKTFSEWNDTYEDLISVNKSRCLVSSNICSIKVTMKLVNKT